MEKPCCIGPKRVGGLSLGIKLGISESVDIAGFTRCKLSGGMERRFHHNLSNAQGVDT